MPTPETSQVLTRNFLPEALRNNVNIQQQIGQLEESIRTAAEVHDFRERIHLTLGAEREEPEPASKDAPRALRGGSPGDWYRNEDQMSRGGDGSGGNWIQD